MKTKAMKTKTKTEFTKAEIQSAEKLKSRMQDVLIELDEIGKAIGNNRILITKGISVNCNFISKPLNDKTKVVFKLQAILPNN